VQARATLTVFETGDATPEQVVAETERRREEERWCLVIQQAKKVHTWALFVFVHCGPLSVFN